MPKKNDVEEMRDKLARLNERAKSAEDGLKKLENKRREIQNLIDEEERKKRTHNLAALEVLCTNTLEIIFLPRNLRKC